MMQTCYIDTRTRTIADLIRPGEVARGWTISRINVPHEHRGKGHGSAILKRICAEADAEKVDLWLQIHPSGPLDFDDLEAWYTRYGFRRHRSGYMVRRPSRRASQSNGIS